MQLFKSKNMQKVKRNLPVVVVIGILFTTGAVFSHVFSKIKPEIPTALADEEGSNGNNISEDSHSNSDSHSNDSHGNDSHSNDNNSGNNENSSHSITSDNHSNNNDESSHSNQKDKQASSDAIKNGENEIKTAQNQSMEADNSQGNKEQSETEKQGGDKNNVQENTDDTTKKVSRIEAEIAPLEASDPKAFKAFISSLSEIKSLIAQSGVAKDPVQIKTLGDIINSKIETLNKMVEVALEDNKNNSNENGNEDVAKQYKNTVAQFVHTLKTVSESDTEDAKGIGEQVKEVAQAQNDSQAKVEESINKVENRSGLVKFLIGPKYGSIAEIQTAITENQSRIKVLTDLMNKANDPAVKLVLQDQINALNQQNAKLQIFATNSDSGFSLFGWLAKMFS